MSEYVKFNLNDYIKVKLKDEGYEHLAKLHNDFIGVIPNWERLDANYYKSQADDKGYTEFQAWYFIQQFGPTINMGSEPIFDTNILIKI